MVEEEYTSEIVIEYAGDTTLVTERIPIATVLEIESATEYSTQYEIVRLSEEESLQCPHKSILRRGSSLRRTQRNGWTLTLSHCKLKIIHCCLLISFCCLQVTVCCLQVAFCKLLFTGFSLQFATQFAVCRWQFQDCSFHIGVSRLQFADLSLQV